MENDEELRKYFDFDEADLFANRNGYMSSKQQARDKKEVRDTRKVLSIVGYCILALAILPVIIFFLVKGQWQSWLWAFIWLLVGVLVAVFVLRLAANTTKEDTLKTVEGRVNIIKEEHEDENLHKYYDYYWNIGAVKFDVADSEKVDILQQGDFYRVYYLDLAKEILSLEKVEKN